MQKYRYELPNPLHLVTFEAAARQLNFTLAARELNVTRVAVSQQMKALEAHLGVSLFSRLPRSLSLTGAGKQYLIAVSEALEGLRQATREIRKSDVSHSVTVTATAATTTYWLMPRIPDFRRVHPDIDIRFFVAERYVDLAAENIDVAIRYGERKWSGLDCSLLFRDEILPLCSTGYLAGHDRQFTAAELLDEALIHLEGEFHGGHMWNHWFSAQGVAVEDIPASIHVNTYSNLIQAALDGQGIALLGRPLVQDRLDTGQLVLACTAPALPRQSRQTFYIAKRRNRPLSEPAQLFHDWLLSCAELEANETRLAGSGQV